MNIKLKQRLIGAIVIFALIVIFVPMLFSKHKKDNIMPIQSSIPQAPQQPKVVINQVGAKTPAQKAQQEATSQNEASKPMVPILSDQGKDQDQYQAKIVTPDQGTKPEVNPKVNKKPNIVMPPKSLNFNEPKEPKQIPAFVQAKEVDPKVTEKPSIVIPAKSPDFNKLKEPKQTSAAVSIPVESAKPIIITKPKTTTETPETSVSKKPVGIMQQPLDEKVDALNIRKSNISSANVVGLEKKTIKPKLIITSHNNQQRIKNAKTANKAYVIQLGVFAQPEHATNLAKKLRAKGFTAFEHKKQQQPGGKILTRVFVGPSVTRPQAKKMLNKLEKEINIRGVVVRFNVAKGLR